MELGKTIEEDTVLFRSGSRTQCSCTLLVSHHHPRDTQISVCRVSGARSARAARAHWYRTQCSLSHTLYTKKMARLPTGGRGGVEWGQNATFHQHDINKKNCPNPVSIRGPSPLYFARFHTNVSIRAAEEEFSWKEKVNSC